jgi:hypothetical protein
MLQGLGVISPMEFINQHPADNKTHLAITTTKTPFQSPSNQLTVDSVTAPTQ